MNSTNRPLRLIAAVAAFSLSVIIPPAFSAAEAPLFPFLISYDAPDNASNMSHLLDAPAGKHGFVRVENGHFVNDRGRIKFHATNLTGPSNFPTHAQADKLAARLARFGINCVRLHYFDSTYGNFMTEKQAGIFGIGDPVPNAFSADPEQPMPRFDPAQIDRQDYLIAALKKRGIYVNINTHVARFRKGVCFFDPLIIASEKEYARALLTRVNPYTGLSYTNDPCVALIEINNENTVFKGHRESGWLASLSGRLAGEVQKQWNAWLVKKYKTTEVMNAAWKTGGAPLAGEQVAEGAFDRPVAFDNKTWRLDAGTSETSAAVADGVLRITVTRDGAETFPKLYRRVSLEKDNLYTVSFRVRRAKGGDSAKLGFAIARTRPGWKQLGVLSPYSAGAEWKTITHTFRATESSAAAEIQFTRFKKGVYEIDDLSFKSGAPNVAGAGARIENGAIALPKSLASAPKQAQDDLYQFVLDTERAYWRTMSDFIKNTLKAKAPVSGTQLNYSPPQTQAELDYVDIHAYWCHPSVNKNWSIGNGAMVGSMQNILSLAGNRVAGKPYTISEFNCPFPNQYGAEGQPLLRAYGAFQGWDGVFEYTYNHTPDFEPRRNTYFFSMIARTEVLAHFPACAAMFLRGDVREARESIIGSMDDATYFDRLATRKHIAANIASVDLDTKLALVHKVAMAFTRAPGGSPAPAPATSLEKADIIQSDTGELTWNREMPEKAYWTVNTPNTKCFSGFPAGREIAMGNIKLDIGATRLNWATVSLTSRHATGFGENGNHATILLAATGLAENEGTVLDPVGKKSVALRDRLHWGDGTVLVEGVPASVTLPSDPAKTKCFALDEHGARKAEVPVEKAKDGCRIEIGPQYKTVWYEISVTGGSK
ncbi:MAG: carbohydrate binding domain-containing protein [Opitutaceae bacterium]|nr:carbohydrate binding domain-containing protein [Opitutaceae bacterium]